MNTRSYDALDGGPERGRPRVDSAGRIAPPPTGQLTPRRNVTARRREMRRRWTSLAATVAAVVLGITVVWPALHHAVRDITLPLSHQDIIRQQAREKHLDPALIAAVIFAESKFRDQTSSAGAEGLMQLLPATAEAIATRSGGTRFSVADLATPQVNIAYGSYYLRLLLDHYSGNTTLAIAAYNAGEANVDRWSATARANGGSLSIATIPFPETRAYVQRVLTAQRAYRANYASELGL
jgi:soluble lytic murein transglycosylase